MSDCIDLEGDEGHEHLRCGTDDLGEKNDLFEYRCHLNDGYNPKSRNDGSIVQPILSVSECIELLRNLRVDLQAFDNLFDLFFVLFNKCIQHCSNVATMIQVAWLLNKWDENSDHGCRYGKWKHVHGSRS